MPSLSATLPTLADRKHVRPALVSFIERGEGSPAHAYEALRAAAQRCSSFAHARIAITDRILSGIRLGHPSYATHGRALLLLQTC